MGELEELLSDMGAKQWVRNRFIAKLREFHATERKDVDEFWNGKKCTDQLNVKEWSCKMGKDNPWADANDYNFGKFTVWVLKADPDAPVRFYTELHHDNGYWGSMGSQMPFAWLAAIQTLLKRNKL